MPTAICNNCGKTTNSTLSDYWNKPIGKVSECYAGWVDGKWVKGCTEPPDGFIKSFVEKMIAPKKY